MRYDPDKPTRLVCTNCLNKKNIKSSTKPAEKPKEPEKTVRYYCIKCHYRFDRRKSAVVTNCPYCGYDSLTTKTDAASILKRAEDEEFER
jgi:DNA-directed RNA polymerase subunit RPC12/RpoP